MVRVHILLEVGLANGSSIVLARTKHVPERAEQHCKSPDQACPVHVDNSNLTRLGPERKEKGKYGVNETHNISHGPPAAQSPWSESDRLFQNSAAQKQDDWHHVRSQDTHDAKGDNGVEGCGRADVDKGEQQTDSDGDGNGVKWQRRARFDLQQCKRRSFNYGKGINSCGEEGYKKYDRTFASQRDPGSPLSRAKAHVIREAVAIKPIVAKKTRARITHTIAVAPPAEFVAW